MLKGRKDDSSKIRMDLLPEEALEEIAKVLSFGATKYGDHNWRGGMTWSRLIGATKRHMNQFIRGLDLDPETGYSHLAHAACCLLFLETYRILKLGKDDRWRAGKSLEGLRYKWEKGELKLWLDDLKELEKCQSQKISSKCPTKSTTPGSASDEPQGKLPSTKPSNVRQKKQR